MTQVLQLILECLKVFWLIFQRWEKWNAEERDLFVKRMQTVQYSFDLILKNQLDAVDETAYLSTLTIEKQFRYNKYCELVEMILSNGGGINDLLNCKSFGLNERIDRTKDKVIDILKLNYNLIDKAKRISQLLTEVII